MGTGLWIFLAGVGLFVVVVIILYNGLVSARQLATNAWSQIDVQLRRRYDLIPNLVETVKGYMSHEKETLENVIQARQMAMDAQGVRQQASAENALTSALGGLFAVAEAYPDLKANQNMLSLQSELSGTEERIALSREYYNDRVTTYNTKIETFPSNMIASTFSFRPKDLFEIESAEMREPVKVSFS